jgi:hypothetical protein
VKESEVRSQGSEGKPVRANVVFCTHGRDVFTLEQSRFLEIQRRSRNFSSFNCKNTAQYVFANTRAGAILPVRCMFRIKKRSCALAPQAREVLLSGARRCMFRIKKRSCPLGACLGSRTVFFVQPCSGQSKGTGAADGAGAIWNLELAVDVLEVIFDGFRADGKLSGDLFIR